MARAREEQVVEERTEQQRKTKATTPQCPHCEELITKIVWLREEVSRLRELHQVQEPYNDATAERALDVPFAFGRRTG